MSSKPGDPPTMVEQSLTRQWQSLRGLLAQRQADQLSWPGHSMSSLGHTPLIDSQVGKEPSSIAASGEPAPASRAAGTPASTLLEVVAVDPAVVAPPAPG